MTLFKDIVIDFLKYKRDFVRPSSISTYTHAFEDYLIPFFGDKTDITQDDIDEFIYQTSKKGLKKKTIAVHICTLKSILSWGNKTNIFNTESFRANYPSDMEPPKEKKPLSAEDAKIFAKYCEDNFTFENLALYTALFTGIRAGEICGLKWSDIDLERNVLRISRNVTRAFFGDGLLKDINEDIKKSELIIGLPKTENSIREIPLSKQLIRYYKPLLKVVNLDWFILSNSRIPLEPRQLQWILKRLIAEAGLPKITLHDLRHTFATRCIALGIDYKTVSEMLGHSSVGTTLKVYTHIDDDAKEKAMNELYKTMKY